MSKVNFKIGGVNIEMESEEVSKAIETGEVQLSSDDLTIYKKDEFDLFKQTLSNEEYKKGKAAGIEMTVKDAREKHGLDFEGKSIDNLIDAIKSKTLAEAKVEPSKKIQELESDRAKLLKNYQDIESQFSTFKTEVTNKETRGRKDNDLLSFIPNEGLKIDRDIALLAIKTKAGIDIDYTDEGFKAVTINGVIQKDEKTLQPIDPKTFIANKLTELGLTSVRNAGNGGGDDTGKGSGGGYEAFVKRMEANNINEGSLDFSIKMDEEMKAGTLKL